MAEFLILTGIAVLGIVSPISKLRYSELRMFQHRYSYPIK